MPLGTEIHYAAMGPDRVADLVSKLGITMINSEDELMSVDDIRNVESRDYDVYDIDQDDSAVIAINDKLLQAYMNVAKRKGWKHLGFDEYPYNDTHVFETPFGERKVSHFSLQFCYDPHEAGDNTSMMSLGVALSSRYVPCYLDIESPHGCLYTVDLITALKDSEIAIEEIVKEVPELADLSLVLREIFY